MVLGSQNGHRQGIKIEERKKGEQEKTIETKVESVIFLMAMVNHKFTAMLCILGLLLGSGHSIKRAKRFINTDMDILKYYEDVTGPSSLFAQTTSNHVLNFSKIIGYLIGGM